jgi:hypothetical protein
MAFDCCAPTIPTDPTKRVDYSYGLVLGVAEFRTEQGYFLAKDRRHARALHGYGTIAGLHVTVAGSEVRVAPGLALDPRGREICVAEPQCAKLEDWLAQQQSSGDLSPPVISPPAGPLTAYVVLCYRECETERVPIPAGPCLSLDRTAVPSRIQDAYELAITTTKPPQIEEEATSALGEILRHVHVEAGAGALTDPKPLVDEIRALAAGSPPVGSLPSPPVDLKLDPASAGAILREALRVWVTEVRPLLVPEGGGCLQGPSDPACVLLAKLAFPIRVSSGQLVVDGTVTVDESERPLLVQTRVLQEILGATSGEVSGGGGGGTAPPAIHPATLSFGAAAVSPIAPAALIFGAGRLPLIRFSGTATAVATAAIPADLIRTAPIAARVSWGVIAGGPPTPAFAWTLTIRYLSPGDSVTGTAGTQTVGIPVAAAMAADTLLVTPPVGLHAPPPPAATLVAITIQATGLPPAPPIAFYCAELLYTARSTP